MIEPILVEEPAEAEDGVYYGKLVEYEEFQGQYKPSVRVFFILDPRYKIKGTINGIFPARATPKNKTGKLLLATTGECIPGKQYSWEIMRNRYCYLTVENHTTAEGRFPRVKGAVYPEPNAAAVERREVLPTRPPDPAPAQPAPPITDDNMPF